MISAIIVENDRLHFEELQRKLLKANKPVEVLAVAGNIENAYNNIINLKPDLVFLDIELDNGETGFELLKKFQKPEFSVIFVTSFNTSSNAIAAIRACALDFLPKPLDLEELNNALSRIEDESNVKQTQTLTDNIGSSDEKLHSIWIQGYDGKMKVEVNNILFIESDGSNTNFHLQTDSKRYNTGKSLKDWEKILANSDLFRVHNEFMVNERHVAKFYSKISGSAEILLSNQKKVPVSKARKSAVKARLGL